ncbi:MAG: 30S ribosomal protein S16 [Chloroflexi bacterium]|nr:30S ribosomal protein S16 [Chloroflexota bacterium]
MVRIRLRRVGRKKQPSFRVVAADKESPRDGRFLEILGFYNPRTEPATIKLKEDRIFDWMSKGAQMSDGAEKVFRSAGLLERYERFKSGEDIEKLLEEALTGEATRNISPKTRRDAPAAILKAEPKAEEKKPKVSEAETKAEDDAVVETEAKAKTDVKKPVAKEEEKKAEEPKIAKTETKAKAEKPADKKDKTPKAKSEKKSKEEKKDDLRASIPEAAFKASLEDLGLAPSITSKLADEGFAKIGDLMLQMKKDQAVILDLAGIGPKTVETISEKIAEYEKANK